MLNIMQNEMPDKLSMILKHMVPSFTGTSLLEAKPVSSLKALSAKIDITILVLGIKIIVSVAFFAACILVMSKMFWMLEQCIPINQEAAFKARAWRWKAIVAAAVLGAWICALGIIFTCNMPKTLWAILYAGPIIVTTPVLAWVFLVR